MKEFNSEDAQERPWAYDHTAAMGAGIGFIIQLIMAIIAGGILEYLIDFNASLYIGTLMCLVTFCFIKYRKKELLSADKVCEANEESIYKQHNSSWLSKYINGCEIDLDLYLQSEYFLPRGKFYFWQIPSAIECREFYQDANGNYWNDGATLANPNGKSKRLKAIAVDEEKTEYDVSFYYERYIDYGGDSMGRAVELEYSRRDKKPTDLNFAHILELEGYVVCPEYSYSLRDENGLSYDNLYYEDFHTVYLFKHGSELLDSRKLSDGCWFKKYALEVPTSAIQIYDYITKNELEDFEKPYLWWATDRLPVKNGLEAFEDNHNNLFYVGEEKNIGICHIHNGVDVSDNPVTIEINWDGYFKINKVDNILM